MNESPVWPGKQSGMGSALREMLRARLNGEINDDAFVGAIRGTCTQSEFVDVLAAALVGEPQSIPRGMLLVNRLHKRGDISADLVSQLESRISRSEQHGVDTVTVDLGSASSACIIGCRPSTPPVEVGRVLRDRYEIERCLGSGGKGTVFRAADRFRSGLPASLRYVAIKVLHEPAANRDQTTEPLRRELQAAQLLAHPNIVKVYDVDRDGELEFFTMELLEGELLSDCIRRSSPRALPRPSAWSIIGQIADGLEHAHTRNVVHADLKPQNIMITRTGEVRILDFGSSYRFAKAGAPVPSLRGSASATPAYACCELLDGRTPDPRDDLYALACIAYELLTGAHPFQRRRANEARDLGVIAIRPSGLSGRQWRTLAKSLSWHRAGRSILVSDWFKALKPGRKRTQPLPSFGDLAPAPTRATRPSALRSSVALSVLLSIAAMSLLFVRLAPGGKANGEAHLASATNDKTAAAISTAQPSAANASNLFPAQIAPARATLNRRTPILPSEYQVRPGQHFAEIRVRRPADARGDAPLTWWTEPASAKPGVDYVSQAKVSQTFPKGRDSMSVFVKLLPKAKRNQAEVFYIAVADRGAKHAGQITHTAVRLPSGPSF